LRNVPKQQPYQRAMYEADMLLDCSGWSFAQQLAVLEEEGGLKFAEFQDFVKHSLFEVWKRDEKCMVFVGLSLFCFHCDISYHSQFMYIEYFGMGNLMHADAMDFVDQAYAFFPDAKPLTEAVEVCKDL
jgi:hypothetical protein